MKESPETSIENAILRRPDLLGFPDALAIRNCRLGRHSGAVDVLLLPKRGPIRVVLVEAKVSQAADAASKVIGQLLMYYAGALTIGQKGWEAMRDFAKKNKKAARGLPRVSLKSLSGGVSPPDAAWKALERGEPLRPDQIRLYVAMNNEPHLAFDPLRETLLEHHNIDIGLILVRNRRISYVDKPNYGKR